MLINKFVLLGLVLFMNVHIAIKEFILNYKIPHFHNNVASREMSYKV